MDWMSCNKKRLVKEVKKDANQIKALLEVSEMKLKSANTLPIEHHYAKITLLYDVLRSILECVALEKGYKIYNHECYTHFLKELLGYSSLADRFDKLRKIRNGINYYGKEISQEEGEDIISRLIGIIDESKSLLSK